MTAYAAIRPGLRIDNAERPDLQDALLAVNVHLPMHGSAHGEVHLTNWGIAEGGQRPNNLLDDIALGGEIEVLMVGANGYETVFSGHITGLEEAYGEGAPQLRLLLQDKLHLLARTRHSRAFEEQSLNDVIGALAQDAGLQADADISSATASYHQLNESNLAFLYRLVSAYNVNARLENGQIRVRAEEPDQQPMTLHPGNSVQRLRLLADLNRQPAATSVSGYDPAAAEPVSGSTDSLVRTPGQQASAVLDELGWTSDEAVPQPFARTAVEAEAFAAGHFERMAQRFLTGHLQCLGEPSLRGGREIELTGVSRRLRGIYRISHCTHHFSSGSGYETHLKLQRGDWQP